MVTPTVDAPTVQQSGAPLGISPPTEAFGASVGGQGLQAQGAAEGQAGDMMEKRAQVLQGINNQNAADAAVQGYAYNLAQARETYKKNLNDALSKNPALDTQAFLGSFLKDQETQRASMASAMTNPMAQQLFNEQSRHLSLITSTAMAGETQAAWTSSTLHNAEDTIQLHQSAAIALNGDPEKAAFDFAAIHAQVQKIAALQGLGPESQQALITQKVSPIYETLFKNAVDTNNAAAAQQILTDHAAHDLTPAAIAQMQGMLKTANAINTVRSPVTDIYDKGIAPSVPGAPSSAANMDDRAFFKTHIAKWEGGQTVTDVNGAPVQWGINKAANPDADVGNLTIDKAADIYQQRYVNQSLQGPIRHAYGEAAFIAGKGNADAWLQQSGGDVDKFLSLESQHEHDLAAANPAKYGPVLHGWDNRNADLRQTLIGGPAGPSFNEAPPKFGPNADPSDIRDQLLSYNLRAAAALFGGPLQEQQHSAFLQQADARANLQANMANDHQTAIWNRVHEMILNGKPDGSVVHGIGDIPPSMLAQLSPGFQSRVEEALNYANQGVGAYKTPEMEKNAGALVALSGVDPVKFENTDLSDPKLRLAAPDFLSLSRLQAGMRRGEQVKEQQATKMNTLLAVPEVKNIIASQFQQADPTNPQYDTRPTAGGAYVPSQAHLAFMGSLSGEVEALQARQPGKPVSQQDIARLAQQLITRQISDANAHGAHAYSFIPPADRAAIAQAWVNKYHSPPSVDQMSWMYHRNNPSAQ